MTIPHVYRERRATKQQLKSVLGIRHRCDRVVKRFENGVACIGNEESASRCRKERMAIRSTSVIIPIPRLGRPGSLRSPRKSETIVCGNQPREICGTIRKASESVSALSARAIYEARVEARRSACDCREQIWRCTNTPSKSSSQIGK